METFIATGEITNTCTCVQFDEDDNPTNEFVSYCYGDCWYDSVDEFANVTTEFRKKNETDWWHVKDLRLWNGDVSGYFHAEAVEDLLRGMAVRGSWVMRYTVFPDRIEYSLSHHDSPTGSNTVLTIMTQEEVENLGL